MAGWRLPGAKCPVAAGREMSWAHRVGAGGCRQQHSSRAHQLSEVVAETQHGEDEKIW